MTTTQDISVSRDEIAWLAENALKQAGASNRTAKLLTDAALFAEDRGLRSVGVVHLLDYIRALKAGRLNPDAAPKVHKVSSAILTCDAEGGPFHIGFETAIDELESAAKSEGVAIFTQSGAYAGGQLGWFTEQLSTRGLVAIGAINSNAFLATAPGTGRVLGTNPLSYSFPRMNGQVMTVDQSSSAAAYVSVREAANDGREIPEGWAIDQSGESTTDALKALDGAMLPFGGYKGANIAWLVELLAGMSGGNWSIDAPAFDAGSDSPGVGMFILAIDVSKLQNGYISRVEELVIRLKDQGVRIPGTSREKQEPKITLITSVLEELESYACDECTVKG